MSPGPNGSPSGAISQEALAVYRDRRRQAAELDRWLRRERQRLVDLVDNGVTAEAGPLRARVRECSQRRLTREVVVATFGQEGFDFMRGVVAPTVYRQLVVEENPPRSLGSLPDRTGSRPRRSDG